MATALIFLAVTSLAPATGTPAAANGVRPAATAHAIARIQVISGARFGPRYLEVPPSARRRSARLADGDGRLRPAELLEFQ